MTEAILKSVRLAFPAIYEPRAMANDAKSRPAYGAKLIIEPGSENANILKDLMNKVAEEKWPGKGAAVLAKLIADKKVAYVEGPYLDKEGEPRDGFEGKFYLSCRNEKLKPTIKNRFNADVREGEQGAPYPGSFNHCAIDLWAQDDPTWGRRINCSLQGLMFAADGDSFGGGRPAGEGTFAGLAAEPTTSDLV